MISLGGLFFLIPLGIIPSKFNRISKEIGLDRKNLKIALSGGTAPLARDSIEQEKKERI